MKDLRVVFLTGGRAKRLWPLADALQGNCFFSLGPGDRATVLGRLVSLAKKIVGAHNIYYIAHHTQQKILQKRYRVSPGNILAEPCAKNTFTAIVFALARLREEFKGKIVLIMPTDCCIEDEKKFKASIAAAYRFLKQDSRASVALFGIRPDFPATDYGYIKKGAAAGKPCKGVRIAKVAAFMEKPAYSRAVSFLKSKHYLWNAGIFMGAYERLCALSKRHGHESARNFFNKDLARISRNGLTALYARSRDISFDLAVLEKAPACFVVEADIKWHDLGNWSSLSFALKKDARGNTICGGKFRGLDVRASLVLLSPEHKVIAIGLRDIVLVSRGTTIFLAHKHSAARLKEIVS